MKKNLFLLEYSRRKTAFFKYTSVFLQMVLMEESRDKPLLVVDRDPEGLSNIVENSQILEASHVREVGDTKQAFICEF